MKKRDSVIFLIDSEAFDRNILGLTLEKITKCKVFNFFSVEESILYWKLNPKLLIYNSDCDYSLHQQIDGSVNLINIAKDITSVNKACKLKDTSIAQEIAEVVNKLLTPHKQ